MLVQGTDIEVEAPCNNDGRHHLTCRRGHDSPTLPLVDSCKLRCGPAESPQHRPQATIGSGTIPWGDSWSWHFSRELARFDQPHL